MGRVDCMRVFVPFALHCQHKAKLLRFDETMNLRVAHYSIKVEYWSLCRVTHESRRPSVLHLAPSNPMYTYSSAMVCVFTILHLMALSSIPNLKNVRLTKNPLRKGPIINYTFDGHPSSTRLEIDQTRESKTKDYPNPPTLEPTRSAAHGVLRVKFCCEQFVSSIAEI